MRELSLWIVALALWNQPTYAQSDAVDRFQLADVFQLELASDPQISPDGSKIVYVRNFMDIMTDRRRSNLWIINYDGTDHRPLTTGNANYSSPRWSPDGSRLLYVSSADGSAQIYVRFMDDGQTAKLTNLQITPSSIVTVLLPLEPVIAATGAVQCLAKSSISPTTSIPRRATRST